MGNIKSLLCCTSNCCSTVENGTKVPVQRLPQQCSEHQGTPVAACRENVDILIPEIPPSAGLSIDSLFDDDLEKESSEVDLDIEAILSPMAHSVDFEEMLDVCSTISLTDIVLEPVDEVMKEIDVTIEPPAEAEPAQPDASTTEKIHCPVEEKPSEPEVSAEENAIVPLPEDAPMSLLDFRCCAVLGKGAFGKVLLAEHQKTKQMLAIKTIKKEIIVSSNDVKGLMSERNILQTASQARHPFVVNLMASFQTKDHACLVMEFGAGGDLLSHFAMAKGIFPVPRATFYAACVVLGLEYLHEQKILYRDLKLENIVLDRDGYAKITDFGSSKEGIGYGDRTSTFCGTLEYMAPEMLTRKSYTRSAEWWSLGVMLYYMLAGKYPIPCPRKMLWKVITSYKIQYPLSFPAKATSILKKLLDKDPEKRLGASKKGAADIKKHPFFKKTNWAELLSKTVTPPFVPDINGPEDRKYFVFSKACTDPLLTLPQGPSLTEEEQDHFKDFDWVAEWAK